MMSPSLSTRMRSVPGFSLAEVLIAIVIITILTIGSLAVYSAQLGRARDTERSNDISRIKLLLDQIIAEYGAPPGTAASGARKLKSKANCIADGKLFDCFIDLKLSTREDLIVMMADPSDGVPIPGKTETYAYKYYSNKNSYEICATLEDQASSLINADAQGKNPPAADATDNMYCLRYIATGGEGDFQPDAKSIVVPEV